MSKPAEYFDRRMICVGVAVDYGANAAFLMEYFSFWTKQNIANGTNYYDGAYWSYNKMSTFTDLFPFMSFKQVRSALDKLKETGLIQIGNYNKSKFDRTNWYALTEKGFDAVGLDYPPKPPEDVDFQNQENGDAPEGKTEMPCKTLPNAPEGKPIPVIDPYIEPISNNNIRTQDSNSLLRENARAHARENLQPIPFTPPAILDRQQRTGKRQPLTVDEQEKATEWFEDFWDVYPKKQGKVEARLAWLRLDYDTELYANIIQTVARFKAIRRDWQKAGGRYVPMPENFLINERWKDEVAEEPALDFDRPMDLATAGALLEEEWRRQNAAFGKTGGDSGKVQGEIPQLGDYL